MVKFFKYFFAVLNTPRFLLHLILFGFFKKKCSEDVITGISFRYGGGKLWLSFLYLMTWDKTFRNIFYYRIGYWRFIVQWLAKPHSSFEIINNAEIGPGLLGIHPFSSIINARKIGKNFSIKNDVTIGNDSKGMSPVIGDNVTVHVCCVIFGDISIGDNVEIGAGTVIHKSVPSNCVVVGNPAYIIKENGIKVNKPL